MNISPLGGLVDSFSTILFYHKPRGDILFLQQKNAVFMRLTAFGKRLNSKLKKGESLEILILQKLSPFYSLVKLYLA